VRNSKLVARRRQGAVVTELCVGASAVGAKLIYFFATEGSNERLNAREKYFVSFSLTIVPALVTYTFESRSVGRGPGGSPGSRGECGARERTCNPLPGGFGSSARPALRPVCEKHRWTVAGRFAGNARLKAPAQEARNWSRVVAFGRLSQNRGGTPIDLRLTLEARLCPTARQTPVASVGVSLPTFSFFRSSFRHCRT
jgi:hypothetical protein